MSEFHFLRPEYLLIIPLVLLLAALLNRSGLASIWASYIEASKLKILLNRHSGGRWRNSFWFALTGVIACLAVAGPTWEKRPVPTTENVAALVVLLDLSPSMMAADLMPDRLTRARLKITDLLRQRVDGQTALIAYAGSAHRVSPLTDDNNTIEALLPALSPAVMPQSGSNVEAAVELALELLTSAGSENKGHLLLVTDGVTPEAQKTIMDRLPAGVHLSILGVGTTEGAPIPLSSGGYLRDSRGDIVLARLNRNELQILAGRSAGRYIELQANDSDIDYLLAFIDEPSGQPEGFTDTTYDTWHDAGYWLVLLLIPMVLYGFRRDLLFCMPFLLIFALPSHRAEAGIWQDLWMTPDQQAAQALQDGDAASAAAQFESPDWKAYAAYQAQDYETAVESLHQSEQPSLYNLGTSLAKAGQLEDALTALDEFLSSNPDHENAKINRDLVAQLLQQQQEQNQENQENQDSDQDQQNKGDQGQDQQQGDSGQEDSDNSQPQDSEPSDDSRAGQQESADQNAEEQEKQDAAESADEQSEQEQQAEQEAAAGQNPEQDSEDQEGQANTAAMETPDELSPSSEQWLRAIPDDPSGLLRRKFEYESQLYQQQRRFLPPKPGSSQEERY